MTRSPPTPRIETCSTLTCPQCGARHRERMAEDSCQYLYDCPSCGALIKPAPGDCCVFCSYGDVPCPPVQAAGGKGSGFRGPG
ncbi:MAG TPA: GDCCVxC domain-containing (seleno)protein [Alphaproteobacteria bacterium]